MQGKIHQNKMESTENPHGKFLSFAEIVQDRDSLVKITEDGMLFAVDLVMVMTGKDRNMAADVLRRIPCELFETKKIVERQSIRGGHPTKLVSFSDAIELVMALPGKKAKKVRIQFADVIRRYLAGDQTIISEINSNAKSTSPVAQLARETAVNGTKTSIRRRRREDDALICNEMVTLAEQMRFVKQAFKFQRTALKLVDYEDLKEQNERILMDLKTDEASLLEEIKTARECNYQLETELLALESGEHSDRLKIIDNIKTIRILIGIRRDSDYDE
jgi:hypothetical protein